MQILRHKYGVDCLINVATIYKNKLFYNLTNSNKKWLIYSSFI